MHRGGCVGDRGRRTTTTSGRRRRDVDATTPRWGEKDESVLARGDDRDRGGVRSSDEEEGSTRIGGVRVGAWVESSGGKRMRRTTEEGGGRRTRVGGIEGCDAIVRG